MQTRTGALSTPPATATAPWTVEDTAVMPSGATLALPGAWTVDGAFITPTLDGTEDDAWDDDGDGTLTPIVPVMVGQPVVETPTGTKNGTNRVFTLSDTPVHLIVRKGASITDEFTWTGTTLTMNVGHAPASTDVLQAIYWPAP